MLPNLWCCQRSLKFGNRYGFKSYFSIKSSPGGQTKVTSQFRRVKSAAFYFSGCCLPTVTSIYKNLINSIRNFCLCSGSFWRSILINFSWTLPILIPNFQSIIFYQWTTVGTHILKTISIHIIPGWPGSAALKLQEVSGHEPLNKRPLRQMKQGGWLGKCRSSPRDQDVRETSFSHNLSYQLPAQGGALKQAILTYPTKQKLSV